VADRYDTVDDAAPASSWASVCDGAFHSSLLSHPVRVATELPDLGLQLIGGAAAYVLLTAMAATSNDAAVRALGPRAWKRLHTVGIYWIWFMFLETYAVRIARGQTFYMIFALPRWWGWSCESRPGRGAGRKADCRASQSLNERA
jgi:hypothetical protein